MSDWLILNAIWFTRNQSERAKKKVYYKIQQEEHSKKWKNILLKYFSGFPIALLESLYPALF
jgi:hypothetical protein